MGEPKLDTSGLEEWYYSLSKEERKRHDSEARAEHQLSMYHDL